MDCGVFVLWADVARRGQRHKTLVLGVHQSCLIKCANACAPGIERNSISVSTCHRAGLGDLGNVIRARRPKRLPVVMTREEVRAVLDHLSDDKLLMDGYDIRTIQELIGHKDVSTTMIYTHILNKGGKGVSSPFDGL